MSDAGLAWTPEVVGPALDRFCEVYWNRLADFAWRKHLETGGKRPFVFVAWKDLQCLILQPESREPFFLQSLTMVDRGPDVAALNDTLERHDPTRAFVVVCGEQAPTRNAEVSLVGLDGAFAWRLKVGDPDQGRPFPPQAAKARAN